MKIEEAIQQKNFKSEKQKLMANLLYSGLWIKENIKSFLEPYSITQQQFNILRILRGAKGEPLSTLQIRERMIDKMSDTSRLVDRLQLKELVRKNPCPHDKRLVQVYISDKGMDVLSKIDEQYKNFHSCLSGLSDDEMKQLNDLLDKMREYKK